MLRESCKRLRRREKEMKHRKPLNKLRLHPKILKILN